MYPFFLLLSVMFPFISTIITCEYQIKPTFHKRMHAHTHAHAHTKAAYCALHKCCNDTSAYQPTVLIFNISRSCLHFLQAIWLVFPKWSQLTPYRSLFLPISFHLTERSGVKGSISLSSSICPGLEFGLETACVMSSK